MRYSDDFRAAAVVMLEAEGYPHKKGALAKVSRHLRVPLSTLHRWYKKKQNPPPSETVSEKKASLEDYLEAEIYAIFHEFEDARWDADYRALATAAGIFIDKLQLLRGNATERTEIVDKRQAKDEITRRLNSFVDASGADGVSEQPIQ